MTCEHEGHDPHGHSEPPGLDLVGAHAHARSVGGEQGPRADQPIEAERRDLPRVASGDGSVALRIREARKRLCGADGGHQIVGWSEVELEETDEPQHREEAEQIGPGVAREMAIAPGPPHGQKAGEHHRGEEEQPLVLGPAREPRREPGEDGKDGCVPSMTLVQGQQYESGEEEEADGHVAVLGDAVKDEKRGREQGQARQQALRPVPEGGQRRRGQTCGAEGEEEGDGGRAGETFTAV